jgi:hypothetical protein
VWFTRLCRPRRPRTSYEDTVRFAAEHNVITRSRPDQHDFVGCDGSRSWSGDRDGALPRRERAVALRPRALLWAAALERDEDRRVRPLCEAVWVAAVDHRSHNDSPRSIHRPTTS